jgi:hypothetical protein
MSLEKLIHQAKPSYINTDKEEVICSILQRLEQSEKQLPESTTTSSRNFSWMMKAVSTVALLGVLLVGSGSMVAWANGKNILTVVVSFVHNITKGEGFGTGYSLANTKIKIDKTEGSIRETNYNSELNTFVGMSQIPKLEVDNISVQNINANMVDRGKQVFYIYADGYVPTGHNQTVHLGLFHNTGGDANIGGQSLENTKLTINLSGIDATYIEFTNNVTVNNFITWKSGDWIFVLRSTDVPKQKILKYAEEIQKQVTKN